MKTLELVWSLTGVPFTLGTWLHLVVTWHVTSGADLYIGGNRVTENNTPDDKGSTDVYQTFEIGRPNNVLDNAAYYSKFLIDELYILERGMTPTEVSEMYELGRSLFSLVSRPKISINIHGIITKRLSSYLPYHTLYNPIFTLLVPAPFNIELHGISRINSMLK